MRLSVCKIYFYIYIYVHLHFWQTIQTAIHNNNNTHIKAHTHTHINHTYYYICVWVGCHTAFITISTIVILSVEYIYINFGNALTFSIMQTKLIVDPISTCNSPEPRMNASGTTTWRFTKCDITPVDVETFTYTNMHVDARISMYGTGSASS